MSEKKIKVHCWADYQDQFRLDSQEWIDCYINNVSKSCLLERGHEGPHEWTDDSEIKIDFCGDAE